MQPFLCCHSFYAVPVLCSPAAMLHSPAGRAPLPATDCLSSELHYLLLLACPQVRYAFLAGLVLSIVLIPVNRWIAQRILAASTTMMASKVGGEGRGGCCCAL